TRSTPRSPHLSLHDALPISYPGFAQLDPAQAEVQRGRGPVPRPHACLVLLFRRLEQRQEDAPAATEVEQAFPVRQQTGKACSTRSEEHTSELQSRFDLVCRL